MPRALVLPLIIATSSIVAACDHPNHKPTGTVPSGQCRSHLPFDVVFAAHDANGLPLNPEWAWQCAFSHHGPLHVAEYPDPHAICEGFTYAGDESVVIGPGCMNGSFELDVPDESVPQWYVICHAHEKPPWLPLEDDSYVHGHVDLQTVTVTGRVSVETSGDELSDGDTNLNMLPGLPSLGQIGAPSSPLATPANLAVSASQEETAPLHLEFAQSEIEPALGEASEWWRSRLANLNGAPASVIGLLGLDNRHDSKAELHPVFGMAAREPGGDTRSEPWLVMWRNTGDQGGCSSHDPLRHTLLTPSNVLTLEVPSPFTKARSVQLVAMKLWREGDPVAARAEPSVTLANHGTRALLSVRLGDPSTEPVIAGEVRLAWLPAAGATSRAPTFAAALPFAATASRPRNGHVHDADELLVQLRRLLPPSTLKRLSSVLRGRAALQAPQRACKAFGSAQASLRRDRPAMELVRDVLDCNGSHPPRVPPAGQRHAAHPRPHILARRLRRNKA